MPAAAGARVREIDHPPVPDDGTGDEFSHSLDHRVAKGVDPAAGDPVEEQEILEVLRRTLVPIGRTLIAASVPFYVVEVFVDRLHRHVGSLRIAVHVLFAESEHFEAVHAAPRRPVVEMAGRRIEIISFPATKNSL